MSVEEEPRVLVGIVTYEGKHYIFPKCYEAVHNFDYKNYDVIIVDNSKTLSYKNKLLREGYKKIHHVNRGKNSRDALSDSQNYIRKYFLNNNYDYLLLVESDLIPRPDTLSRLINHDKPVVGSLYFIGADKIKMPCVFLLDYKKDKGVMGTRLIKPKEINSYVYKGLKKVHGCGFGCTLIRRDVVERFVFWTDERFDNKHSDVYFYMDLQNEGVPVFIDTNVIVPHFPTKWEDVEDR